MQLSKRAEGLDAPCHFWLRRARLGDGAGRRSRRVRRPFLPELAKFRIVPMTHEGGTLPAIREFALVTCAFSRDEPPSAALALPRDRDALNGVLASATPGARSTRRLSLKSAPARRSGSAREDIRGRVVEYVAANPGSTASDVANALGLNRNSVAARLTQLSKRGEIAKAQRGYSAAY
jgi:hypothetical protein